MLKKLIITVLCAIMAPSASQAATAVPALVGHNTLHKIEKLIALRQIDDHFQDRLYSLQVQVLTPAKPGDPAFKATVSQVPDAAGKAQQVVVFLDSAAKALSFSAVPGPASTNAPVWPDIDALTLGQDGLHYVLDNGTNNDLKPFYNGMVSQTLSQAQDTTGNLLARVQFQAKDSKAILDVYLKPDGSFVSYKVSNP